MGCKYIKRHHLASKKCNNMSKGYQLRFSLSDNCDRMVYPHSYHIGSEAVPCLPHVELLHIGYCIDSIDTFQGRGTVELLFSSSVRTCHVSQYTTPQVTSIHPYVY